MNRGSVKKAFLAVPMIAGAVALSACGSSLDHGVITGKHVSPEYWYTTTYCASYGKYGCRLWLPLPEHQPAQYVLDLRDPKNPKTTGSVDVDQSTWDAAKVGGMYPEGSK